MHIFVVRLIACVAFGVAALSVIDASALALTGVKFRKVHGAAGSFDRTIDTTQAFGAAVTVEPRAIGAGGHVIVFQFDGPVTATGTASATDAFGPVGSVSAAITGATSNEVSVTLTGIPDNKRVTVSLTGVADGIGPINPAPVSVGFLMGDVNNTLSVTASDVTQVKVRSGQPAVAASVLFDINTTGTINASDISSVKARAGLTLVAANEVSLVISKSGTGTGSVSSVPVKINCGSGAGCMGNFTQNTSVALTATPAPSSTFAGWSGGCSGAAATINVVLATSLNCTATFTAIPMMANLSWSPVTSANLSGYRVYYGTTPGTYIQAAGQGLDAGNITSYAVSGLNSGTRYYFAVKAYDASGVESAFSNEVFKDIP